MTEGGVFGGTSLEQLGVRGSLGPLVTLKGPSRDLVAGVVQSRRGVWPVASYIS